MLDAQIFSFWCGPGGDAGNQVPDHKAGIRAGGQQYDRPRWATIGQARCAAAEGYWLKKAAAPRAISSAETSSI
jgi:hypothetical protein